MLSEETVLALAVAGVAEFTLLSLQAVIQVEVRDQSAKGRVGGGGVGERQSGLLKGVCQHRCHHFFDGQRSGGYSGESRRGDGGGATQRDEMARKNRWAERLKGVELFSACNTSELKRIDSLTFSLSAQTGKLITQEGDRDQQFFVIVQGIARASKGAKALGRLGPGSYFPELALLDRREQPITVTAETEMDLLVFSVIEFRTLLGIPSVSEKLRDEWRYESGERWKLRVTSHNSVCPTPGADLGPSIRRHRPSGQPISAHRASRNGLLITIESESKSDTN
jgi:hypothetical protein